MNVPKRPDLATLVSLHRWLQNDAQLDYTERLQRDQKIAVALALDAEAPAHQHVIQWAARIPDLAEADQHWTFSIHFSHWLATGVGGLSGMLITSTALGYAGDAPVNLLTLLLAILALPILGFLPPVYHGLRQLSGRTVKPPVWLLFRLRKQTDPRLNFLLQNLPFYQRSLFWRWQQLMNAFYLAYMLAAALALLFTVTFYDIAFGWSSTLAISSEALHTALRALASPWAAWWPAASPSLDLIELSRYYRLQGDTATDPARLGQWWPFVLACILVWGLLPRVLMLLLTNWRRQRADAFALTEHPECKALVHRLQSPTQIYRADTDKSAAEFNAFAKAATQNTVPDIETTAGPASEALTSEAPSEATSAPAVRLSWNHVDDDGCSLRAFSGQGASARQAVIADLLAQGVDVHIWTKSWEPPTGEFFDFLSDVRQLLGANTRLIVHPQALPGASVRQADMQVWLEAMGRHADRNTMVAAAAQEPRPVQ
ncbi:MAG: DUF2868 domain-containing protein [Pseudomonadota bacterium]